VWGGITGTLSNQTDLQTALNAKLNLSGGTLTGDLVLPGMTITSLTGYLYANGSSAVTASTTIPIAALSYDSTAVNSQTCTLGSSCTVTAETPNSLTFNSGGSGGASGSTFNGASALTVSYNTVGAAASNASTTVNGQTCTLGSSCTVTAAATGITVGTTTVSSGTTGYILYDNGGTLGNLATTGSGSVVLATSPSVSGLTVTSSFTATGLVTNTDLANASTTVNGSTCTLGSSCTVTAAAGTLTGTTLNSTVVSSSLTSVGTITSGVWNGTLIGAAYGGTGIDSSASTGVAQVSAGVWSISTVVSATHLVGISSTPTITVGTGVGTGGTATCAGFHCSDMNGVVNVTVGTSPSANATVFTVTFASPYGNIVNCVYNVTNETLATGVYVPAYLTEAAAYIAIVAPTGNAWTAGSEYSVNYFCGQ
jgi:hypothetical protein